MSPHGEFISGLILAAGGSSRLGQPKQLLPYRGSTLLGHVVDVARGCRFDQIVVVLGGAAADVRRGVDLAGVDIVENRSYGSGCSSSIAAALPEVDARTELLVLMLGDQPGVKAGHVRMLVAGRGRAPIAACRYDDGLGHPLLFARTEFPELGALHGDKAVWKLLERRAAEVVEVQVPGPIPADVDTWDDYAALGAAP